MRAHDIGELPGDIIRSYLRQSDRSCEGPWSQDAKIAEYSRIVLRSVSKLREKVGKPSKLSVYRTHRTNTNIQLQSGLVAGHIEGCSIFPFEVITPHYTGLSRSSHTLKSWITVLNPTALEQRISNLESIIFRDVPELRK